MEINDYIKRTKEVNGCFSIFLLMFFITFIPLLLESKDVLINKGLLFSLLYAMEFLVIFPLYLFFFRKRTGMGKGMLNWQNLAMFLLTILIIQFVMPHILEVKKAEVWMIEQVSLSGWPLFFNVVLLTFIVPIYEEIVFRGCLFNALMYWFNDKVYLVAIVLSAIFSILHTQYSDWRTIFLLFLVSLVLTAARVKSKGILSPIILHIFMNGVVSLV